MAAMPSSNVYLAPQIVTMAAEVRPRAVLDVGPGHGKYGVLFREYVRPRRLDAVEAEERYPDQFPWLDVIYDDLRVADVTTMADDELDAYDLVLMIDVLEHLDEAAGAALLSRIRGRIIVCTPRDFFQNPEADDGWESERHRSLWDARTIEAAASRSLEVNDVDAWRMGGVLVRVAAR